MKVGETNAFAVQAIEIRGLQHGIPVTRKISITLIIREDEDDAGTGTVRRDNSENQQEESAKGHAAVDGAVRSASVSIPHPGRE